ncbi:hypothetical protein PSH77_14035 [Pseudomonas extremorientalis]|uniref:hypothetical protein n=1 Tax=Pseudomonas extremorientalis TaxID=169669 RepID=UPI0027340088|nr:hypothetical protein [Pseudomonas extremorientalis]WLG59604.1 hypothetical protein PSH77_14035 [Pseudomonas extremorientalis]
MSELQQGYAFHFADLVEYAKDKPIGAARAALIMALEEADVSPDVVMGELSENMELNQDFMSQLSNALRKNSKKIIGEMPIRIQVTQLERDLEL